MCKYVYILMHIFFQCLMYIVSIYICIYKCIGIFTCLFVCVFPFYILCMSECRISLCNKSLSPSLVQCHCKRPLLGCSKRSAHHTPLPPPAKTTTSRTNQKPTNTKKNPVETFSSVLLALDLSVTLFFSLSRTRKEKIPFLSSCNTGRNIIYSCLIFIPYTTQRCRVL